MKKTLILGILCVGLISACNRDQDCVTCSNKATTWSDGEITITVPNVFTPANFSTCDSMVFSTVTQTYMEPSFNYVASKYNVPRSTIISWVRKARLFKSLPNTTPMIQEGFLNITPR